MLAKSVRGNHGGTVYDSLHSLRLTQGGSYTPEEFAIFRNGRRVR